MNDTPITCNLVDRDDLDTRYVTGTLDEPLAQAFEEHFFSCDRCWALVHRGVEVRSVGGGTAVKSMPGKATRRRRLLLVAVLAPAAALALWIGTRPPTGNEGADAIMRGTGDTLALTTSAAQGVVRAAWALIPEAASYRVRIFSDDGTVLWDRRVTDTTVSVARDSIAGVEPGQFFWQVQALDLAGAAIGRSPLVAVPAPIDTTR